ncbi:hypothetical protein [Emticicia sp. 21SJ11W-3]|uniref:hypothetical protein n=1 Tax=Emticicia sp. 21SJ11W-3 TaxID=2916755 RepID=UPI0020A0ED49|nr:hypothetical protein [Emticicia sp. 21SJ11W-3]UTA66533.1 hypothetical protein MB380_13080 [Emticicia sp. 21SJ11W-3]
MKNQTKKYQKSNNGFVYAQGDLSAFDTRNDGYRNEHPVSGSDFERRDTESFVRYVKANYKDGHKITHK